MIDLRPGRVPWNCIGKFFMQHVTLKIVTSFFKERYIHLFSCHLFLKVSHDEISMSNCCETVGGFSTNDSGHSLQKWW